MSKGRETQRRRNRLSRFLDRLGPSGWKSPKTAGRKPRSERLVLEGLETRRLLAADAPLDETDFIGPIDTRVEVAEVASASVTSASVTSASGPTVATQAEGEPAPDLVQFAKDLADAGVVYYGAAWCPACTQQKQLFEDGGDELPFVEVTNPDRSIGQIGIDNNIQAYPTWDFPDGSRETGVLTLQQLSDRSGVPIPQSETPIFKDIGDQTVLIGSPLHVPVDAYDPDGGPLTVTVSVDNPNLVEASVISGNRSIRIDMATYDDMVFQLFEQRAPTAAGRVIELAEDGFYDGIIFHRVIDDFVIQGGDPTGTGTSGSTLPDFDDEFHPELQHNRSGVLSFAKSSDDTNNSQFFVTEVPTRFLDFNHSVFGQLIEGESVREAISEHAVNGSDRPTTDIAIDTIDVFTDTENSLLMLKATGAGEGSTNVTVTVTDEDGNSFDETFQVDVSNDTQNSQPYLNAVTVPERFDPGTPATLQMSSTDIEGDPVTYSAQVVSSGTGATASIDQNGLLTVTPASGFTGEVDVNVTVRPGPGVTGNGLNDSDNQVLTFNFEADDALPAPTSIDLQSGSDTGVSDTDNITNDGTLAFTVDGVSDGATVQLINVQTSAVLGDAVASGSSATVTTNNIASLGDGTYQIAARQVLGGEVSQLSGSLTLTYDNTAPASVTGSANTRANAGRLYQTDLISDEEGSITYAFVNAPNEATINSGSGLIEWTPDSGDVGNVEFEISTTDLAGNSRTESFTVVVADEPLAEVRLIARDADGNELTSLSVGEAFTLELVGVDARIPVDRDGVFAIYTDILFDSSIVRPVSGATIERVGNFTLSPRGNFADGLIDELGAALTVTQATNEAQSVVARVPMEAIAAGNVNLRSEEADNSGNDILLFGEDNQIPAESVFYGNLILSVGLDFSLNDDNATVAEDSGSTQIDVLANDTQGGSSLSVISVTQPTSGGTVDVDSGVVSFTPASNFNGTTEFTYRAGTSTGAQDTATVTVTVTAVNDAPTAVADTFNVDQDSGTNELDVLANDSDVDNGSESLIIDAVTSSSVGATIAVNSDGSAIEYTPPSGFTGTDSFTYVVSDGQASTTAAVTVTVAPADDPPTAVDDSFTINEDTAEASYDVLANDTADADNQSFVIDSVETPSEGGSARVSSDGSAFFYEPADNFFGSETVIYTIRDTGGGLAAATVTFTVESVNDPPPVISPTVQRLRGTDESVVLQLSDLPENVDGDSETLTLTNLGTPTAGGTVRIDADGNLLYTPPDADFSGTDTVTYSVSDGSGTNADGTVTIEVRDFTERNIRVRFSAGQARSVASSVRLAGSDALGNSIDSIPTFDATTNELIFEDVLPGQYTVEIPAIPFFSGAETPQQIAINSDPEDGDAVVEASMGRLKPEYLSINDWLGSAPRQSLMVAIEPGGSALVSQESSTSSDAIRTPSVSLNEAGTALTIEGQNDSDEDVSATVLVNDGDAVESIGQVDDMRLLRINVATDVLSYTPVSSSSNATAQQAATQLASDASAEGEDVAAAVTEQIVTPGSGLSVQAAAEGEDAQPLSPRSLDNLFRHWF